MYGARDSVIIIGVGRSGMATAKVLRERGAGVVAYDDAPAERLVAQRAELADLGVPLVGPQELPHAVRAATGAVVSPGVPLTHPAVRAVQAAGVAVVSEIELAYTIARGPLIAVTGTKGKSTTTALIGHLLSEAGLTNRVGGNIGNPLVIEAAAAPHGAWIVAEVSSFQLESIRTFAPRISVLLNITEDHLDRYPSMEEYAEAKYRIFANQSRGDVFIGNADDAYCALLRTGKARRVPCPAVWFGANASDRGLRLVRLGDVLVVRDRRREVPLAAVADLRLRGAHNVANAMAAALAALHAGAPLEAVRRGLRTFAPLPHRLATVHVAHGVTWIDDSKATNPAATVAALEAVDGPILLIAGGRSKNTDFRPLAHAAARRAKCVILIGEAAREIGSQIDGPPVQYARNLEEAVAAAAAAAVAGDAVLLSPGCASFDMFESAEQRGERFACLARSTGAGGRNVAAS